MSEAIAAVEEEIIDEFSMLDGDMEMTINYLMELGDKMPPFPEEARIEDNIVKGCQSKVWLIADEKDGKLVLQGDSNTAITKGLVSLLIRVLTDQPVEEVLEAELSFPEKIGMRRFIGTQRSNGFAAMMKQIKMYALAYKTKMESNA